MTPSVWRIGQLLNSVQSTFVGLLRIWSIPIVLLLSVASGYTTYYGMSYFITGWIALIVTIAVQSIIVIATLELASIHWKANLSRYLSFLASLLIALGVSVSFSYFKFYEFSERDNILMKNHHRFEEDLARYMDGVAALKVEMMAKQKQRVEDAAREANQAYLGIHPSMMREEFKARAGKVGKGPFWNLYHEAEQRELSELEKLEEAFNNLDLQMSDLRFSLKDFSFQMTEASSYEKVVSRYGQLQSEVENLAAKYGVQPVKAPMLAPFAKVTSGMMPTFDMWNEISWFALACAAMVDFFTVILSYRLEFTAPGPLTEDEKELAYLGLRQFSNFTINQNDELEFQIERTELERARRIPDWSRMFAVAFLLNRGYLRKISANKVEFAPNLYPVISERMRGRSDPSGVPSQVGENAIRQLLEKKRHG